MRKCPRCQGDGPFNKAVSRRDGRTVYCRACTKVLGKEYRTRNADKVRERNMKYRKSEAGRKVQKVAAKRWRDRDPERAREAARRSYQKNKARHHAATNRWRAANRDRVRELEKRWRAANPEKMRNKQYKTLYGITLAEWEALFVCQGKKCAVCGTREPGKRRWATDHDHATDRIRGILCHSCNLLLGQMGDQLDRVQQRMVMFLSYLVRASVRHEVERHVRQAVASLLGRRKK